MTSEARWSGDFEHTVASEARWSSDFERAVGFSEATGQRPVRPNWRPVQPKQRPVRPKHGICGVSGAQKCRKPPAPLTFAQKFNLKASPLPPAPPLLTDGLLACCLGGFSEYMDGWNRQVGDWQVGN